MYGTGNNSNNHRWWPWIDPEIAKRFIGLLGGKDFRYSDNGGIRQEAYPLVATGFGVFGCGTSGHVWLWFAGWYTGWYSSELESRFLYGIR